MESGEIISTSMRYAEKDLPTYIIEYSPQLITVIRKQYILNAASPQNTQEDVTFTYEDGLLTSKVSTKGEMVKLKYDKKLKKISWVKNNEKHFLTILQREI